MKNLRVALPVMPFASLARPPIGPAILKAIAEDAGHVCTVQSLHYDFARRIGREAYNASVGSAAKEQDGVAYDAFFGEWLFSRGEFGVNSAEQADFIEWVATEGLAAQLEVINKLTLDIKDHISPFLEACVKRISDWQPDVIGLSCTFQQTLPCLELARRLKTRIPNVPIIFGGASCASSMGRTLISAFEQVDAICTGEGENSFVAYLEMVASGKTHPISGIVFRSNDGLVDGGDQQPVEGLDGYPSPDFSDFFNECNESERKDVRLQYEATRGCWWGEKHHCTFCGQNATGMKYRAKSPERVAVDLTTMAKKFDVRTVEFCDNILDMGYFKTLLPVLRKKWPPLHLFFEIKSNLNRGQVKLLREAGVFEVQPGIESFSSEILRLMKKGVSGAQNIALLKWCCLYGITAHWNILGGFPGERAINYQVMASMVPSLSHLPPPTAVGAIRIDRFSPYHERYKDFGIQGIRPYDGYRMIYPDRSEEFYSGVAYHFEPMGFDRSKGLPYMKLLEEMCDAWREGWTAGSKLTLVADGERYFVEDFRALMEKKVTEVSRSLAGAIAFLDSPRKLGSLRGKLDDKEIEDLRASRWMIDDDDGWLVSPVLVGDGLLASLMPREIEIHSI